MAKHIEEFIEKFKECADDTAQMRLLNTTVDPVIATNPKKACRLLEELSAIKKLVPGEKYQGTWHFKYAYCSHMIGYPARSIEHYHRALEVFQKYQALGNVGVTHMNLASVHLTLSQFEQALNEIHKALDIARQIGRDTLLFEAMVMQGTIYGTAGELEKSLRILLDTQEIGERLGDSVDVAGLQANIGAQYMRINDFQNAENYLQRACEGFKASGITHQLPASLSNLGFLLISQGKASEAIEVLQEALESSKTSGRKDYATSALVNLSKAFLQLHDLNTAEMYGKEALHYAEIHDIPFDIAHAQTACGKVAMARGNYKEALGAYLKAIALLEKAAEPLLEYQLYELLAKAYEQMGNETEALKAYKKHYQKKGEYLSSEKQRALASIHWEYERHKTDAGTTNATRTTRLEQEVEANRRELSTLALRLSQKNKALAELQVEVETLLADENQTIRQRLLPVLSEIKSAIRSEDDWDTFERQLNKGYPEFIQKLLAICPDMTPTELRICSLTRTGLSTKEIADFLSISPRSAETYRYRIRKKLGLDTQTNLVTYLHTL